MSAGLHSKVFVYILASIVASGTVPNLAKQNPLHVVPNADSDCFEKPCYTLGDLIQHQQVLSASSDATLIFSSGSYTITTKANYPLIFSNMASVDISAEENSIVHIVCRGSKTQFGIVFTRVRNVTMNGISISRCSGTKVLGITHGAAVLFHSTNFILVSNINVSGSHSLGISGINNYGNTTLKNITLESNAYGNMKFVWNDDESECIGSHDNNISFVLKHSLLVEGGLWDVNETSMTSGGLGLSLDNHCTDSIYIHIMNTKVVNSTGQSGVISVVGTPRTLPHTTVKISTFKGSTVIGGYDSSVESLVMICTQNESEDIISLFLRTVNSTNVNTDDSLTGGPIGFQTVNVCQNIEIQINDTNVSVINNNATWKERKITYTIHSVKMKERAHFLTSQQQKSLISKGIVSSLDSDCPIGFILTGQPPSCQCNYKLFDYGIFCNKTDFTLSRHGNGWIGLDCIEPSYNCTDNVVILHKHCPLDYCKQGVVKLNESDQLCTNGRTGLLCAQCQANFSVMLGGNMCGVCSNSTVAFILLFLIAGVLLVFVVTSLNLTVTDGAINGLIVYAGIIHLNKAAFFPPGESNVLTIFLSWVNLDFGFQVCFYNGMTVYEKIWLQFIFPVYLVIIAILIIIASEYSQTIQRITRVNTRVNVMCTLFLLVYLKVLRTITMALSYTSVSHSDGTSTVWLYDGSPYASGKHIALLTVSVVVAILIVIPYTAMLLFSPLLQRLQYFRAEWALKFVSIMEAYSGPYKIRYRFWIGLLVFAYTLAMTVFITTGGDYYTNLTTIAVCCCLLVFLKTLFGGVYKKSIHDITESFYLLNLCVLSVTILFARQGSREDYQSSTYTLVSLALIVSLVILIVHIYYSSSRLQKCVKRIKSSDLAFRLKVRPSLSSYLQLEDINEQELQGQYHEASQLSISMCELNLEEKVPDEWIPTDYPPPVFREDPVLLSESVRECQLNASPSHSDTHEDSPTDSSSASAAKSGSVQSVVLVVDRNEEEAVLLDNQMSEPIRSKCTSFDTEGNKSTIIEDVAAHDHSHIKSNETRHQKMSSSLENSFNVMSSIPEEKSDESNANSQEDSPDTNATGQKSDTGRDSERSTECYSYSSSTQIGDKLISRYPRVRSCPSVSKRRLTPVKRKPCNKKKMTAKIKLSHNEKIPTSKFAESSVYCQCTSMAFLADPLQKFTATSTGREFVCLDHDITIKIPPGAIYSGVHVNIEVGVLLHGPFVFPEGFKPISPILWVCASPKIKFQKPVEIIMPHVLSNLNEKECRFHGVTFLKAHHSDHISQQKGDKKRFQFKSITSKAKFSSSQGSLNTNHFCFYCIAAKESQEFYQRASYCITRIEPKPWPSSYPETTIFFCVSYFLSTCIKVPSYLPTSYCSYQPCQY